MKLVVLGKYGTFPARGGACSGYLIQSEKTNILLDCGNGVLSRSQTFLKVQDIDAVILSHLHYDHMADIFLLKYFYETSFALGKSYKKKQLFLPLSPQEIAKEIYEGDLFDVIPIQEGETALLGDVTLLFTATTHLVESYAISFYNAGKKITYSGDSGLCRSLIESASDADLFLCESTFATDEEKNQCNHHLSACEAGKVAKEAVVKKLLLTHLWYESDENQHLANSRRFFSNTSVAEEMKQYDI